eukprot:TRINITY_DN6262_c0_g1_i7.p1 TRINITY_DN6262_c0_g1~~TRINITY_DN6262_c0_g1_i7.p1  ORF type:complete len:1136 (+),score=309.67 TRINITY_DN6262_c0_g1_i7:451-3858(+)
MTQGRSCSNPWGAKRSTLQVASLPVPSTANHSMGRASRQSGQSARGGKKRAPQPGHLVPHTSPCSRRSMKSLILLKAVKPLVPKRSKRRSFSGLSLATDHLPITSTLAQRPTPPTLCTRPMAGSFTCMSPAWPRSCCTMVRTWLPPVAPMGWPLLSRPPSTFTGMEPSWQVSLERISSGPPPGSANPRFSQAIISAMVKQSCTSATSMSLGPTPAMAQAWLAARRATSKPLNSSRRARFTGAEAAPRPMSHTGSFMPSSRTFSSLAKIRALEPSALAQQSMTLRGSATGSAVRHCSRFTGLRYTAFSLSWPQVAALTRIRARSSSLAPQRAKQARANMAQQAGIMVPKGLSHWMSAPRPMRSWLSALVISLIFWKPSTIMQSCSPPLIMPQAMRTPVVEEQHSDSTQAVGWGLSPQYSAMTPAGERWRSYSGAEQINEPRMSLRSRSASARASRKDSKASSLMEPGQPRTKADCPTPMMATLPMMSILSERWQNHAALLLFEQVLFDAPDGAFLEGLAELDEGRNLEVGQLARAPGAHLILAQGGAVGQLDKGLDLLLAGAQLRGHPDHRRFLDELVGVKHRLDLGGADQLAPAADDFLFAAHEVDVAFIVAVAHVAGVDPAVPLGLGGLGRVAVVLQHHRRVLDDDLALRVRGQLLVLLIHDAHLVAHRRVGVLHGNPDGAGLAGQGALAGAHDGQGGLGQRVDGLDLEAEALLKGAVDVGGHVARHHGLDRVGAVDLLGLPGPHPRGHRLHQHHFGGPVLHGLLDDLGAAEALQQDQAGPGVQHSHGGVDLGVGVEQGIGGHHPVLGGDAHGVGVGLASGHPAVVGVQDPLGQAGGARGVDAHAGRLLVHRDLQGRAVAAHQPAEPLMARRLFGRAGYPNPLQAGLGLGLHPLQDLKKLGLQDHGLGPGVAQDVAHLRLGEHRIDGHGHRAQHVESEPGVEELGRVGLHDGHEVAGPHPPRGQAPGGLVDALVHLAVTDLLIGEEQKGLVGLFAGPLLPKLGYVHGQSPVISRLRSTSSVSTFWVSAGCRKTMRESSPPGRGSLSRRPTPAASNSLMAFSMFSTRQAMWWKPGPLSSRNWPMRPAPGAVGCSSSTSTSPTGRKAMRTEISSRVSTLTVLSPKAFSNSSRAGSN